MQFLICTVDVNPCPPESLSMLSMADAVNPATLGVTPEVVAYMFAWGFFSVLFFWFLGYVTGLAIDVVKQVN